MRAGLLPLYIDIYDVHSRHVRPRLRAFYDEIAKRLGDFGIEIITTEDFCCLKPQFEEAVALFESAHADAIITLHMAYSPSLEAVDALVGTDLPIVICDTTETRTFTNLQSEGEIMYNHGIHGVMDLASMLKRRGKPYAIAAGHFETSDVLRETAGLVRAAVAAKAFSCQKVGLFGGAFEGMGDFAVDPEELKERFGVSVETFPAELLPKAADEVSREAARKEAALDREHYDFPADVDEQGYERSVAVGLGLRKIIADRGLTAFSVNFRTVRELPFIECCKAMERGTGYAGEGDALTAAVCGALLSGFPETGFVEIFCPDWENDMLYLSHMGEVNYRLIESKPSVAHAGGFVDTYAAYARMKGGKGVYVNVSRGPEDYELLLAPAEMLSFDTDHFTGSMRGWMRPGNGMSTAEFLKTLSVNGATHHSAFVYGATADELAFFGRLLAMKTVIL